MRKDDIRFSGKAATINHHSARGKVIRNSGSFTRGTQLLTHEVLMTWAGIKIPLFIMLLCWLLITSLFLTLFLVEHEIQLVLMRAYAWAWNMVDLSPEKRINLTLPDGSMVNGPMLAVPYHPAVAAAVDQALRCILAGAVGSAFLTVPLTIWFVNISHRRGLDILKERHERGAMLVERPVLVHEITKHNRAELAAECAKHPKKPDPEKVAALPAARRVRLGFHAPYVMAGVPVPWRLEQSHAMLIGTTGSGKTTQLRSLVAQARRRGHRCVVFDLTGAFVEAFYNPETDTILNPMDERCPPWTIFNDCENYADYTAAAAALIPSDGNNAEPFWAMAARTLFVETCIKLKELGKTTNGDIAHDLMQADLKRIHQMLANTIAEPLTATQAAKMAESIRAVFNTNAQVLRFLPDPSDGNPPFSIVEWMTGNSTPRAILFISSTHADLTLNRALLTLWMDMAVNALMRMPRTRELRTWFLFDEVHALHRLPAIEHGLQTARAYGGAFVLGMHSFDKLAETYGENGAVNLASLARTKLILSTADMETAKRCADFIGNREVRQMDEAYSYGYNSTRDASTLTPRTLVEPLVIPDDIVNLPSMHGFVKFPDGFPAAPIVLKWRSYPEVAPPYLRKKVLTHSAPTNSRGSDHAEGEEGSGLAPIHAPGEVAEGQSEQGAKGPLSEAELAAEALEVRAAREVGARERETDTAAHPANQDETADLAKGPRANIAKLRSGGLTDESGRAGKLKHHVRQLAQKPQQARAQEHEHQVIREERLGIGSEREKQRHDPEHDLEDGYEMGD